MNDRRNYETRLTSAESHQLDNGGLELSHPITIRVGPNRKRTWNEWIHFDTAWNHVRRWLRDSLAAEKNVEIGVLADILAPPGCYSCRPADYLEAEEEALHSRQILHCDALKELKDWIVGCRFTGSNSEGLTIVGDDDFMWIIANAVSEVFPTQFAGFYQVKRRSDPDLPGNIFGSSELIPNDLVKSWLFALNGDVEKFVHGPAVTSEQYVSKLSEDNVVCLQWDGWPLRTDRQQFAEKLTEKLQPFVQKSAIDQICALPALFVPVSHPSKKRDRFCWRLSFAVHERIIMNSFIDPERKRVYCLLRVIIQYAKYKTPALSAIKTYHIKTLFFWLSSSTSKCEEWNFLNKFHQLCTDIERAFLTKSITNFFLPDQNLLGHVKGLRSVAKWFRSHLLSDCNRRASFLAVLHITCENMYLAHNSCRSNIADCASSLPIAIKLIASRSAPFDEYYVSLLSQVAQLLPQLPGEVHTEDAIVNAVFYMQRLRNYMLTRDPCRQSSVTREFLSVACVQLLFFTLQTNAENDALRLNRIDQKPNKRVFGVAIKKIMRRQRGKCRFAKLTLHTKDDKEHIAKCYPLGRSIVRTTKSSQRKRTLDHQRLSNCFRWELSNAVQHEERYQETWRGLDIDTWTYRFCAELRLFQENRFLAKIQLESEVFPVWYLIGGNYLVDYVSLGHELLFALHAFHCYRPSCIVLVALRFLDWLDAVQPEDYRGNEWLYANKLSILRELMENMRPYVKSHEWETHVFSFLNRRSVQLVSRHVLTLLLCSMAEFHHRNAYLRQRCAVLRCNIINSRTLELTPFEAVIVTCQFFDSCPQDKCPYV